MKKFFKDVVKFFSNANEYRIANNAAACAFSLFLSVVPFLIIIIALVPYTPITEEWLISISNSLFPNEVNGFVRSIIDELYNSSFSTISISAVVLLWSCSRSLVYIRDSLNDIYGYKEEKNFVVVRTIATAFMIIVVLAIVGISFLGVAASYAKTLISTLGLKSPTWLTTIIDYRVIIVLISLFFSNTIIYCLLPAKKNKLINELPGALLTTIVCYTLLLAFNFLLKEFISFSMYGSLATIIIIMFYLYWCCYIFLLGAYFNHFMKVNK